jgi:hypothetical protein
VERTEDRNKIIISNSDIIEVDKNDDKIYFMNDQPINTTDNELEKFRVTNAIHEIVNKFAISQYENTVILTGAGSSILKLNNTEESLIKEEDGTIPQYSGKTMYELKVAIKDALSSNDTFNLNELSNISKYNIDDEDDKFNLEDLLSRVTISRDFIDDTDKYLRTVKTIESKIRELCILRKCKFHKHNEFLNKLSTRRKSQNRVKIFTTNYDTLFEQAALSEGFILVDGFSYDTERRFNSTYFDYDFVIRGENKITDEPIYVDKVIHLHKLHGSVDWVKENENIKKVANTKDSDALMIFPTSGKFEQSYTKPYFELFSRFQIELRKKNTLLIVIGFSFGDKHIKSMVLDAMVNNPHLMILIVSPDINTNSNYNEFIERANNYSNIMLYNAKFNDFVDSYKKQKAYSLNLFNEDETYV